MAPKYVNCKHIQRKPAEVVLTKEIGEQIRSNYRVMPMFEGALNQYSYIKYYSLENNEFLRCRWFEYSQDNSVLLTSHEPLIFPSNSDDHFFNGRCQRKPELTLSNQTDFRYKMTPGPGVDRNGTQKPIPDEFIMKRSGGTKQAKKKRNTKAAKDNKIQGVES